jgi:hypothetical protein
LHLISHRFWEIIHLLWRSIDQTIHCLIIIKLIISFLQIYFLFHLFDFTYCCRVRWILTGFKCFLR